MGEQRGPNDVGREHGTGGVAVVLVSHDGARWLPAVLDGLAAQRRVPDHVVAVDTGSRDESADLLKAALGEDAVVREKLTMTFPQAIARGLQELGPSPAEWIWILHDDSNPDPGALAALLAAADDDPEADILGPKLREWPSLRRLLELGVTISGTGRRETGLERGEYDQGQHDEVRQVLAVNTAGMLVRRSVLDELDGFDDRMPIFGNDIDFGWRATRAGHRTVIVPQAVVFHAEAAHRGVRKTALTGRHTHLAERTAAIYTLLANSTASLLPFQLVRLFFGSMLRALGYVVVRSPGEAIDEFAAVLSVYLRPQTIIAARRERSPLAANDERVRSLLAPRWLPYRHGLDAVSDLAAAATNQAADVAERRRAAAYAERGEAPPVRAPEDELGEDSGLVVRFLTNPVALVMTGFVLVALWLARDALGSAALSGPGLSPAPEAAADWWRLHAQSWHPLGQGSDVAAPAYVLPAALAATLLLGHPGGVVSLALLLAVPLATWGAWRFLRVLGRLADPHGASRWLLAWGSVTYASVPIVSGAWAQGRFGTVVAAALLPWLSHAALGFADPTPDRRWRSAWRAALLLALIAAFAPVAWVYAGLGTLVMLVLGLVFARGLITDRTIWGPLVTPVLATPVLLVPWFAPMLLQGHASALLLEVGRPPGPVAGALGVLSGRLDGLAAPHWAGVLLVALAAAALVLTRSRGQVLVAWCAAGLAAVVAAPLSHLLLTLPTIDARPATGFLIVVIQAAAVVAVTLGLQRLWIGTDGRHLHWPALVALAVAAVVPAAGLGWALFSGQQSLGQDADTGIPAYMTQAAETGPEHGILVVTGSVASGLTYTVQRGAGVTLGEDEILTLTESDRSLTDDISTLISEPTPEVVDDLAAHGIEYVVLPAPADGQVAAGLDATAGLDQASAQDPSTRAWHLTTEPSATFLDGYTSWLRWLLLALQTVAILSVAVLCGPTRKESR
ncbi:Glycosyl transferase, family 2 [metagenome]|uniref:Glycosyl transferase, family 2 n=1 Tax=metagenome TaxID=256318 RepID=A0A2P2CBS5_9ZZZZ